jgi:DNA-binding NarL/FixJ family response regulator
MKSQILIIEDEQIVAENLATTIQQHLGVHSIIVDNEDDAARHFTRDHVDLIISDINLYGESKGPAIVQQLQRIRYAPVIYLTAYSEDQDLKAALDTQPVAYVLKPFLERQILVAVKMGLGGLTDGAGSSDEITKPTPRELEILQLIADGLSSKKIAEKLFISEHTVSTHRKNILKRYRMESTMELVAFAVKHKWIRM